MEKLRKARAPLRATFTRLHNELIAEIANTPTDKKKLKLIMAKLEEKFVKVSVFDKQILAFLIDEEASEEVYGNECENVDEYEEKLIECRVQLDEIFNPMPEEPNPQSIADPDEHNLGKSKFRLPKLELQKFGGELKDWLCFWSLFKKINDDDKIDPEDKFQYLLQSTIPGSRAREMVESYPPTAENYPKIIVSLKQRFGREDLLVEVYVRELLRLVLQNAVSVREKVPVSKIFDKLECHMRALDTLGVTSDKCASMLYPLVESCLPEEILRAWQRCATPTPNSTATNRLTNLMEFLRSEVEGEERIKLARTGFGLTAENSGKLKKKEVSEDVPTAAGLFTGDTNSFSKSIKCLFCDKRHNSADCFQAPKMTLEARKSCIQKGRGCFVCLKVSHRAKDCRSSVSCSVCHKKHLKVMCPESSAKSSDSKEKKREVPASTSQGMANVSCSHEVSLQTLIVKVYSSKPNSVGHYVRALVDSASQRSYVLKSTVTKLGLNADGEEKITHALFGGTQTAQTLHRRYEITVGHPKNNYTSKFEVLDQDKICHDIPRIREGKWIDELSNRGVWISDYGTGASEIELLIGADCAGKLLSGNVIHLKSGLTAVEAHLGWTLMGKLLGSDSVKSSTLLITTLLSSDLCLPELWKLETIGIMDSGESKLRSEMEAAAKAHFTNTVIVNGEGRYEVHLPWIQNHPPLPTNRAVAERRLFSTTKKLEADGRFDDYQKVFNEWEQEGVIEKVIRCDSDKVHYLPHRAVIKESSETTKIRPVFDASAKEKGHPSLNDCLEKGPNMIENIPSTVIRFRMGKIGIVSDIRKAFLQVAINPIDCEFLRFLWWSDRDKSNVITYRHKRAVFGATSSPFLLAAVLELHLQSVQGEMKPTALKLLDSFYVDNCVTSVDSESELITFIEQAKSIMSKGMFDLRGWEHTWLTKNQDSKKETQLLGMIWNKDEDVLRCDLEGLKDLPTGTVTKRKILSVAHKLFDTIGFTCPVTLYPKCLLQETWKLKVGWDSELPSDIAGKFIRWAEDLRMLERLHIPRWFGGMSGAGEKWSLHMFSDASGVAYAACVYLRIERELGIVVQLVQAKSRVAPINKLSIPRLELLSCLIGCRLAQTVKTSLNMKDIRTYYWNDSATALHWIKTDDLWGTFVGNRVKEIKALSASDEWRHVPGAMNPADLPSRGCSVRKLVESKWWEGPRWLKGPKFNWPNTSAVINIDEVNSERKKTVVSMFVGTRETFRFAQYFSGYEKIVRMIAWILRFSYNSKKDSEHIKGELQVHELRTAETRLIRLVQRESFSSKEDVKFKTLRVYYDEEGLLRVKTSIERRVDETNFKYPVVLPSDHIIVHLLIRELHLRNGHVGVQTLMSILREDYWILRSRKTIRAVLTKCIRCKRFQSTNLQSIPITLPEDRVRDAVAFEITGVDLAGPLFLKGGEKAWVVLFTCAVYRAVHLELVSSLSTEFFLLALRRFVSRRGRPAIIYSDNGTNFVGAENLFKVLDWKAIQTFSSVRRIVWKFNPPSAAWWGGWWERLVRAMKNILRRVLGRASLTLEVMNTVLCDTEAVINNRPLTYVSEEPDDLIALTPSMFLQERREFDVADLDVIDHRSMQRKIKHRQQLMDQLRQRFRAEYLGQLVQRQKDKKEYRQIAVGDVVLIGSDNAKRLDWPLAKVTELMPGKDGNTRVVRLRTSNGEYTRPIQRVYPLEVNATEDPIKSVQIVNERSVEEIKEVRQVPTDTPVTEIQRVIRTKCGRCVKIPNRYTGLSAFVLF